MVSKGSTELLSVYYYLGDLLTRYQSRLIGSLVVTFGGGYLLLGREKPRSQEVERVAQTYHPRSEGQPERVNTAGSVRESQPAGSDLVRLPFIKGSLDPLLKIRP